MEIWLKGLTLGFAYVAPIGMQNLFVINSALNLKKLRAMIMALIVIFFDISLALGCFFGIGELMKRSDFIQMAILLVGSVLLILTGYKLMKEKKTGEIEKVNTNKTIGETIILAFVVTWFNPQALIDGTMILGAVQKTIAVSERLNFILGFTMASFLWFISLTLLVYVFKDKFNGKILNKINKVCGLAILVYGFVLMWNFFKFFI